MSKGDPETSDRSGLRKDPANLFEEMYVLGYKLAGLHICMRRDPDEVEVMLRNLRPRHPRPADFLKGEMEGQMRLKDRVMSESGR